MALNTTAIQALQGGPSPFQQTMGGFQIGQQQQQEEIAAQQVAADTQAKRERQMATRTALAELAGMDKPTGQDFARLMINFPEVAEQLKQPFEIMSADERSNAISNSRNVYAALESGNTDIARELLEDRMAAATNAGDEEEAAGAEALLKILDADVNSAKSAAGLFLASAMGPEEFDNTLTELRARRGEAPDAKDLIEGVDPESGKQAFFERDKTGRLVQVLGATPAKKSPLTQINLGDGDVGKIEPGFRQIRDEAGNIVRQEVIPGSPADISAKKELKQNKIASINLIQKGRTTIRDLGKLQANIKGNVGLFPGIVSKIPGTKQFDYTKQIDTLKSRLAIDSMLELKAKSPTGSTGFGALSERELSVIMEQIANLDNFQLPEQFRENIGRIMESYKKNSQFTELSFLEPKTDPQERWDQILGVGFSIDDAKTIMNADQMEIPQDAPAGEFDGFSIVE